MRINGQHNSPFSQALRLQGQLTEAMAEQVRAEDRVNDIIAQLMAMRDAGDIHQTDMDRLVNGAWELGHNNTLYSPAVMHSGPQYVDNRNRRFR